MRRNLSLSCAAALLFCLFAGTVVLAQSDQPSLADIAKRKSAAKAKKVVTNDEIPPSPEANNPPPSPAGASASGKSAAPPNSAPAAGKDAATKSQPAPEMQSKMQQLTAETGNLQKVIKQLEEKMAASNDPELNNTLAQVLQHAKDALADNQAQLDKLKASGAARVQPPAETAPAASQAAPSQQPPPK